MQYHHYLMHSPYGKKKWIMSKQDVTFEVESAEEKDIYIKAALKTEVRPLIDFTTNRIVVKSKGNKKDS